ncbi:MAG: hypothetical protein C7B46_09660 [Sulfobacillus benefaciens]|uniref:Uncharacterized protein n=1 Tax=Sulfobacillus benefaciens TaxID=453960 RepID=A0A2T2XGA2_9FIRM|nr:MAG: hypothetical protein C7B46_09660 [Sulfobacillus benefaciens]
MCSSWSRGLLVAGIMASFAVHWMVIVPLWVITAQVLTRTTHRSWWPSTLACGLSSSRREDPVHE